MSEKRRVPWVSNSGRPTTRTEVKCDCGRWVLCAGFTNTCECGVDFNMSGTRLAPRECWGEETGETANDIIMAEAAGFPELDDY